MTAAQPPADADAALPPWHRMCEVARIGGWRAALAALQAEVGLDVLVLGPAGHAVASSDVVAGAARIRISGVVRPRDPAVETRCALPVQDCVTVRTRLTGIGLSGEVPETGGLVDPPWATALAGLRLGLSYGLLAEALDHLGNRYSGDTPLLAQQMVKATLADAAVEQLQIRGVLEAAGPEAPAWHALTEVHAWLTQVDRSLLRLFGARGFVEGGPGRTVHVSELLADAYVGPDDGGIPRDRP